jgi:hypothetical protein
MFSIITIKIILFIFAILLNFRHPRLLILTVIIGIDMFLPIPVDEGRTVWCIDCIFIDFIAGFLVLFFETKISCALCLTCLSLIPVHSVYLQLGSANFPEYRAIVPFFECLMIIFCIIGGITETYPKRKFSEALSKYIGWMFFKEKAK